MAICLGVVILLVFFLPPVVLIACAARLGRRPLLAGHDGLSRFTVFTIGGPIGNPVALQASCGMMVDVFRGLPTVAVVRLAVTFNGIRQSDGLARNGCRSIVESPWRRTSTELKRKEPSWSKVPLTRNSL